MLLPLAEQLGEFQMPRPIFTNSERIDFHRRHLQQPSHRFGDAHGHCQSPEVQGYRSATRTSRGQLVPFFRDTLVGLNYAYYEPPGAQALHNNPLLIRSHDFSGETVMGTERIALADSPPLWRGLSGGGGAHLVGSLADLPYVLAQMEEDFIAPENVQALIWTDLVPAVLTNAVLPRWWNVTPQRTPRRRALSTRRRRNLAAAAQNEATAWKGDQHSSDRMIPQRRRGWRARCAPDARPSSPQITPADTFYSTAEFRRRFPDDTGSLGTGGSRIARLVAAGSSGTQLGPLSQDFGVPHPMLARTYARELLNVRPFPMFQGYSSRLFAETWDSDESVLGPPG